jgi:hypothetical protein
MLKVFVKSVEDFVVLLVKDIVIEVKARHSLRSIKLFIIKILFIIN